MKRRRRTRLGAAGSVCTWEGTPGSFDTRYGAEALAYLRRRSRENPWFAVVSGIMHAGQIDYNHQQPIAERVLTRLPHEMFDFRTVAALAKDAQDYSRIVAAIPVGAGCYLKLCGADGKACYSDSGKLSKPGTQLIECLRTAKLPLSPEDVRTLKSLPTPDGSNVWNALYKASYGAIEWTKPRKKGARPKLVAVPAHRKSIKNAVHTDLKPLNFPRPETPQSIPEDGFYVEGTQLGAKTRNLVGEYLGCDNAVAVDRHINNWMANKSRRLGWYQKITMYKTDSLGRERTYKWFGQVVFAPVSDHAKLVRMRQQGIPVVSSQEGKYFALPKRELQAMAHECGVVPAELQVAAWAQGVCESPAPGVRGERGELRTDHIWLGDGSRVMCSDVPRIRVPPETQVARVFQQNELPKVPKDPFECEPGYLGQVPSERPVAPGAAGAPGTIQGLPLLTRPPVPVAPGDRFEYGPVVAVKFQPRVGLQPGLPRFPRPPVRRPGFQPLFNGPRRRKAR